MPMPATAISSLRPAGDINGFFGLVVDNISILAFIATVLVGVFGMPAEIVYTKMFPGTALGVLVGNVLYTRMAITLARREGRSDVTAMPLGLDRPVSGPAGCLSSPPRGSRADIRCPAVSCAAGPRTRPVARPGRA